MLPSNRHRVIVTLSYRRLRVEAAFHEYGADHATRYSHRPVATFRDFRPLSDARRPRPRHGGGRLSTAIPRLRRRTRRSSARRRHRTGSFRSVLRPSRGPGSPGQPHRRHHPPAQRPGRRTQRRILFPDGIRHRCDFHPAGAISRGGTHLHRSRLPRQRRPDDLVVRSVMPSSAVSII